MRFLVASTLASLALALSACSSSSTNDADGAGGSNAAGGTSSGTGGGTGVGGMPGSGGLASTGGVTGSGGATGSGGGGGGTISGPLSMGYILDLPGGTSDIDNIDYTAADYVIHAFYTADGAGNVIAASGSNTDDYRNAGLVTKVHAAGRRIVMSLGGANHSSQLKTVAANPTLRATFVSNVVAKINEWGYDGVDLDLEFPWGGNEPQEHLDLVNALHTAVKANDASHIVMFGVSPGYLLHQYKWAQLGAASDYAFYFCYDWDMPANGPMKNPGQTLTMADGGPTIEASCSGALNYILSQGFPASQIIVGLPFYANGGANYSTIPAALKTATPDPNYMEVSDGSGGWWPNVAGTQMKMDAVLDASKSVLTGSATVAGVGWWEWGYENTSSPDLSQAIKAKLGK